MESRLIYIVSGKIKSKVVWYKMIDTEWIYFGAGSEVNSDIVQQHIDEHFQDNRLFISWTRQGSFEVSKTEFIKRVNNILGLANFHVWSYSFDKVIEFNNIGVLRCGIVES